LAQRQHRHRGIANAAQKYHGGNGGVGAAGGGEAWRAGGAISGGVGNGLA